MSALEILQSQLRAVERLYDRAAGVFVETKRKIEAGEAPYEPPYFDPEHDYPEPPFIEEWVDADQFQDVIGQACLSIVSASLQEFFKELLQRNGIAGQAEKYISQKPKVKGESWLHKYIWFFGNAFSIDWALSPIPITDLEEINLARNSVQHGTAALGLNRYQSETHRERFPTGLFMSEFDRASATEDDFHRSFVHLHVSADALHEAIDRVERFCQFVENSIDKSRM